MIAATVAERGSKLPITAGIGPVAGRLLERTRRTSRFASASAFVNYASLRSSRGNSALVTRWVTRCV
jgi:hypothetical protein